MLKDLARDAVELTRAVMGRDPGARDVFGTALRNDSLPILVMTRLRERARRLRVPGVNHALRRAQTVIFGIELGNDVTIGRGVWFVHPVGVVIGGDARIGDRVRFMGSNTIGELRPGDGGIPPSRTTRSSAAARGSWARFASARAL